MQDKDEILNRLYRAVELYGELGFEYLPVRKADIERLMTAERAVPASCPPPSAEEKPSAVSGNKAEVLQALKEKADTCVKCRLSESRNAVVFGEGSPDADLMFVGEGPGREEDLQARPFVGDAGKLLTSLIVKLGMKRTDVYIGNIIKCRPPSNRNPREDEISSCRPFIEEQINIIKPKVIVCLGKVAAHALLNVKTPISRMRGHFFHYDDIPVMPTFHPAYLLRNPKDKWLTWDDMKQVLRKLGYALPGDPGN